MRKDQRLSPPALLKALLPYTELSDRIGPPGNRSPEGMGGSFGSISSRPLYMVTDPEGPEPVMSLPSSPGLMPLFQGQSDPQSSRDRSDITITIETLRIANGATEGIGTVHRPAILSYFLNHV